MGGFRITGRPCTRLLYVLHRGRGVGRRDGRREGRRERQSIQSLRALGHLAVPTRIYPYVEKDGGKEGGRTDVQTEGGSSGASANEAHRPKRKVLACRCCREPSVVHGSVCDHVTDSGRSLRIALPLHVGSCHATRKGAFKRRR